MPTNPLYTHIHTSYSDMVDPNDSLPEDTEEIYQERIDALSTEKKEDLIGYLIEAQDEVEYLKKQVSILKSKIK